MATTRTNFLQSRRDKCTAELAELQKAYDSLTTDSARIDKINNGLPILEALIAEVQDARLRGEWLELYNRYTERATNWDSSIANWSSKIVEVTAKIAEIDRLLAV